MHSFYGLTLCSFSLHPAQVIAITGKSYRVKEAPSVSQENKKQRKANEPSTAGAAS
jgi:hypothetical protein